MEINVKVGKEADFKQDLAVFFLSEGKEKQQIHAFEQEISAVATELMSQKLISGKANQVFTTPTFGKTKSGAVSFIGLGNGKKYNLEQVRQAGGAIAHAARSVKAKNVRVDFSGLLLEKMSSAEVARVLTEGLKLGSYEFREYKTDENPDVVLLETVVLVVDDNSKISEIEQGIMHGEIESEAAIFARNLVNRPPSQLHPRTLKETAESIAAESDGMITIKTFNRDDLREMGAGAILGVAQGSEFEPFLIHLEYNPNFVIARSEATRQSSDTSFAPDAGRSPRSARDDNHIKSVALVGKGVTFDSGGYSLKPAASMEDMKMDMAGAALMLGVFSVLSKLKPKILVHGIAPCVENMVSDRAMRVGDVLKTMSGKTVEVQNTDAEGRLILADAITYAERLKPDVILDFATLTGACMVALGDQIAGLMCDDVKLIKSIHEACTASGELVCELPLYTGYEDDMKSEIADLSNIHKGRFGGAIMGGLFLKQFVVKTPWAHFDIAGPAFAHKSFNSYTPFGGTGFGVRTILHWLKQV